MLVLLIITVGFRLPFQGPYLYDGDPVAYVNGAETLLEEGRYLIDGRIPIWPIGTSLTLVPFLAGCKILCGSAEAGAFWHGVFFIYLAVALTYLLGKRIFNPGAGLIGALLLSLAESPFIHSVNAASDPGALAMLLGGSYLMLLFLDTQSPRDLFLSFFLFGAAFVFRWNYVFFLPLFIIYLVGDRRIWAFHLYPSFWILGFLGFLAGIAIQLLTNYLQMGNPFKIGYAQLGYSEQFIFNGLVYLKNIVRVIYRVLFTWDFFSPLLAMFGLLAVAGLWREHRRDVFWLFVPWIVLGSLSVIYFGVKPRLLMPIMPPLFLLGGEGLVRAYTILRSVPGFQKLPVRASQIAFSLMALILFSPMFARTLLHAHGHFQDKVVMQQAFRWAGSHADKSQAKLITQPYYAGQNADWLRAGWDVWASRRYAGCKIRSLQFPETWKTEPRDWVVINTFWFEGGNLRFDNTRTLAARFDSLKTARQLELKKRFEGQPEPLLLKKFNMLTVYPVDFMEYRPEFEIWGPVEE